MIKSALILAVIDISKFRYYFEATSMFGRFLKRFWFVDKSK